MKIFIINPDYGVTEAQIKQRCSILSNYVSEDVYLHMECLTKNIIEIDSSLDAALAAPEIISMAYNAQQSGYDAVVLYCFSDPAIDACREILSIPVIGAGQAALLQAPVISRQTGLLLANGNRYAEKKFFINQCGINPLYISAISSISTDNIDVWQQRDLVLSRLTQAGAQLIEQDHVHALILGCLSFLGLGQPLSQNLGIPVIDPAIAAVATAESIVRQKLYTSRKSYPTPPKRERIWSNGTLQL